MARNAPGSRSGYSIEAKSRAARSNSSASLRPARRSTNSCMRLHPHFFERDALLAELTAGRIGVVAGVELGEIVERQVAEVVRPRRRLIDHHGHADYLGTAGFQEFFHLGELAARTQDVVHQHHLFAGMLLEIL